MPPRSKIAQLPEEFRAWLHKAYVERGFGDIEGVTQELNALLAKAGYPEKIGKSAVGVESQRVKRAQEAIKATTEAARLIYEASPDDAAYRAMGVMASIEEGFFTAMMDLREAEVELDPVARITLMAKAGAGMAKLAEARVTQAKWAGEVDARVQAAAAKADKLAKKGGMSPDTRKQLVETILGIKTPGAVSG